MKSKSRNLLKQCLRVKLTKFIHVDELIYDEFGVNFNDIRIGATIETITSLLRELEINDILDDIT